MPRHPLTYAQTDLLRTIEQLRERTESAYLVAQAEGQQDHARALARVKQSCDDLLESLRALPRARR